MNIAQSPRPPPDSASAQQQQQFTVKTDPTLFPYVTGAGRRLWLVNSFAGKAIITVNMIKVLRVAGKHS